MTWLLVAGFVTLYIIGGIGTALIYTILIHTLCNGKENEVWWSNPLLMVPLWPIYVLVVVCRVLFYILSGR